MHLAVSTSRTLSGLQLAILATLICSQAISAASVSSGGLFRRNDTVPAINEYLERRADLIAEERAIRFDASMIGNATAKELKAVEIVDALRRREQESIWYSDPNKEPGMPFLWAKNTIIQTDLFKLLKKASTSLTIANRYSAVLIRGNTRCLKERYCTPIRMPYAKYLFQLALDYPNIHLRTASGVNSSGSFPTPIFRPLSQTEANQYVNNSLPISPDYVPNSWVSLQRFREAFPNSLGGQDGFDNWIISAMTISDNDAYVQYNTTAKIWAKFTNTFLVALESKHLHFDKINTNSFLQGLTRYEPIYRRYLDQLLVSQIEDGISYVEIRLGYSPARTVISEDGTRNLTNSQVLDITQSIIDGVKSRLREQGRGNDFIGARIIYSATRSISMPEMVQQLDDCLELKAKYPELIAGFDMAGQEDPGHPLIFFAEALLDFRSKAEKRGLDIPFMFHAGETLDDGGEVDSNLYDAYLLGAKRIGHGFSLAKHPLLMQKYRENGIAVEVCPISNELLRLTRSANTHILPILLNNGVPVALSSDDPAVFQNPGLSFDFYQAIVASNITSILSLGKLARQSLEYSSLNKTAKDAALELWEARWVEFIDEIVASN